MTCLVLLPGMDGTGLLFAPFVPALDDAIKTLVIAYPTQQVLDYTQLEVYVRERLPADEPFVLLGESFSGPIAISIAANPPGNLTGLILCCSFARNPRPALSGLKALANVVVGLKSAAMASPFLFGSYSNAMLRCQLGRALAQVSSMVMRARLRAVMEVDVTERLRQIRLPLLYLRATHDRLVPASAGKLVATHAPQARIVDVDGPHMLLQAMPATAANSVQRFVEQPT
jgi:pimeloyl-ACP methyl ester carboxylesterase